MKGFDKRDYIALQNTWLTCILEYLKETSEDHRFSIIDDFKDSLVDVQPKGNLALRNNYDEWERDEWKEMCKIHLFNWKKENSFQAAVKENIIKEYEKIKLDYNYLRYRKIMQIIQDSGIGLGAKKNTPIISRKGYGNG